jgi:hypothetical protein
MHRRLKRIITGLCVTGLGFASAALAGPQHWGFGFGYLVTVEQNERGQRALSVYEPPLRVKDGALSGPPGCRNLPAGRPRGY